MQHIVKAGETLSGIAKTYGISTWGTVYYAEQNASFRTKRPDPNRIHPGDKIWIPDATEQPSTGAKEKPRTQTHKPAGMTGFRHNNAAKAQTPVVTVPINASPMPKAPDKEPLSISPAELARGSAFIPDGYLTFLGNLFGGRRFELNDMASHVEDYARSKYEKPKVGNQGGVVSTATSRDPKFERSLTRATGTITVALKGMDAMEGFCAGYDAYRLIVAGREPRVALGKILKCASKMWSVIPANYTDAAVRSLAGMLGRVDKLRPIASVTREMQFIGAMPDFLGLMSSIVLLDQGAAAADFKNLIQALSRNAQAAARIAPAFVEFFVGLVPNHMKAKLLAKAGIRKVPVIGTAIMAVTDIVEIVSESMKDNVSKDKEGGTNEYLIGSKYAGLASTLMGLFPGVGTVGSILADVVGIGLVAIGELQRLELAVQPF